MSDETETVVDVEHEEIVDADVTPATVGRPYGSDLEKYEAQPPATLFKTDDPVEIVQRATAVADALAPIIDQKGLFKQIGAKKHVLVEGWTLLGSMTGVFPVLEGDVEAVVNPEGIKGFKATVSAQTLGGAVVGRATAFCMRNESRWRNADDYAVASMAQTRATSKALRVPLGFIVTLAGYEATPAEERDTESAGSGGRETAGAASQGSTAAASADDKEALEAGRQKIRDGLTALTGKPGWSEAEVLAQASLMWSRPIENLDDLRLDELRAIYKGMVEHGGLVA